jgi:hypothetical protein
VEIDSVSRKDFLDQIRTSTKERFERNRWQERRKGLASYFRPSPKETLYEIVRVC